MDVIMPQMGETVQEGTISVWHKKEGDEVKADEILFEIETDKVSMEVPAPSDGTLKEIKVQEGDTAKVGEVCCILEESGAAAKQSSEKDEKEESKDQPSKDQPSKDQPSKDQPSKEQPKEEAKPASKGNGKDSGGTMDVIMPQMGETVQEGTISAWQKKEGDEVKTDDILFEIETDKVSMEVPSPADGVLKEIKVQEGDTAKVGEVCCVLSGVAGGKQEEEAAPSEDYSPTPEPAESAASSAAASQSSSGGVTAASRGNGKHGKLSPVVRRLLAEHDLDPSQIEGTGADGRIKRNDVLNFIDQGGAGAKEEKPAAPAKGKAIETRPAEIDWEGDKKVIPFNRIRKATAEHMVMSKQTSAHVLQAVEVNFQNVDKVRKAASKEWKAKEGFSLTYLPFIARALCMVLPEFPNLNASVEDESLVLHRRINLGIAVDLNFEGLIVPVIKDADGKTVRGLARDIRDLAQKARDEKLTMDDLSGGTYSISNSGTFGTMITAPVIAQPQVAILSTDGVKKKPVVIEGEDGDSIAIRPVGVIAQCFDHRAVDGAYSAAFLHRLQEILENHDWAGELR